MRDLQKSAQMSPVVLWSSFSFSWIYIKKMSVILLGACFFVSCTEKKKDYNRTDLNTFLSEYDPVMKVKREELIRNLALNREQVSKLILLKKSYKSQRAQLFVEKKVATLQGQGECLESLLNEIDAAIEVSLAAKQMNEVDAGGLKSSESEALLGQAGRLIKQSNDLSNDVGDLFSDKHPEDPFSPKTKQDAENDRKPESLSNSKKISRNTMNAESLEIREQSGTINRANKIANEAAMPGERFPQTRIGELTLVFVESLSLTQLRYAINEMFARHGAIFSDKEIASVFRDKNWYVAKKGLSYDQIEHSIFSDVERRNLLILSAEREKKSSIGFTTNRNVSTHFRQGVANSAVIDDKDGWANLRSQPDIYARVVRRIYQEETFQVTHANGDWFRVVTQLQESGWMHNSVVRLTNFN
jgi:hypothetical protein